MKVKDLILELQKHPENCEVELQYETYAFRSIERVYLKHIQQDGNTVLVVVIEERSQ